MTVYKVIILLSLAVFVYSTNDITEQTNAMEVTKINETGSSSFIIQPPINLVLGYKHQWLISTPVNTKISFSFDKFDLPESDECREAYVEIFDGDSTFDRKIFPTKLCGNNQQLHTKVSGTGSSIVLVYFATKAKSLMDFKFLWTSDAIENLHNEKAKKKTKVKDCTGPPPDSKVFQTSESVIWSQNEGYWPSVAIITEDQLTVKRSYDMCCQGIIISSTKILTSWGCVRHLKSYKAVVYVGKQVANTEETSEQMLKVKKIYRIANVSEAGDSGLAVLVLKDKFVSTPYVKPACLEAGSKASSGSTATPIDQTSKVIEGRCFVVAWNISDQTGPPLPLKGAVALTMISQAEMAKLTRSLDYKPTQEIQCGIIEQRVVMPKTIEGGSIVCHAQQKWRTQGIVKETEILPDGKTAIFFAPISRLLLGK